MKPHIKKVNNSWQCVTRGSMKEWSVGVTPKGAYEAWENKKKNEDEYQKLLSLAVKHLKSNRMYLYKGA